jgi:hypothetical protein
LVGGGGRGGWWGTQHDGAMTHPVFLFCFLLEAWELEKLRNYTQQGMYSKEAQFRRRQTNELLALQKRIQAGRDEQKKLRQRDLECLLQRYQNVKSELETAQNLERIRMDRYAGQTAATMGIVGNKAKRLKEAARNR